MTPPETHREHVVGLDAIRFVLAIWVTIFHFGVPLSDAARNTLLWPVVGVARNAFHGSAAVMAFFVISGFCIHFPHRHKAAVDLLPYYARRHVRILIPVGVAVALASVLGLGAMSLEKRILWTLVCEEVYYTIYPALLAVRRWGLGWLLMSAACFAGTAAFYAARGQAMPFRGGIWTDWLLFAPVWLVGCWMAENFGRLKTPAPTTRNLWLVRGAVWIYSVVAGRLHAHTAISHAYSLKFFAIPVLFWLVMEVRRYCHRPPPILEPLGAFSYSLYLVHEPVQVALARWLNVQLVRAPMAWALAFVAALAVAWVFYQLVERPSHDAARRLYRWVDRNRATRSSDLSIST